MAAPRIFVSSTCYDLASERDSLVDFCKGFGFDVSMSERGDVFFHPDLHTHEACINEIGNCHILILIIGGRFGGRYVADQKKSITNAEYSAAREADIPIFTFIKQDVLQDHNLWQSNKTQPFASEIRFPSIDKQEHAVDIFRFIDEVRLSKNGNSYFSFMLPRDIHVALRKQWAGMFLEALRHRGIAKQLSITTETLAKLSAASEKLEEITKSIYKNVDRNAESAIISLDSLSKAKEMFHLVGSRLADKEFLASMDVEGVCNKPPGEWWEFLQQTAYFDVEYVAKPDGTASPSLVYLEMERLPIKRGRSKRANSDIDVLESSYAEFLGLTPAVRRQVCNEFVHRRSTTEEVEDE